MDRLRLRQYLSEHPHYASFLVWLDRSFKSPILSYKGLARTVKAVMDQPLGLLTEGDRNKK